MSDEPRFRTGDKVSWNSHDGTATGTVVRKLTEPMDIEGHHVAASRNNVEYLVRDWGRQPRRARAGDAHQALVASSRGTHDQISLADGRP